MSAAGALLRGFSSRHRGDGGAPALPGGSKRPARGRGGRGRRRRKFEPDVVVVKGKVRVLSFSGVFTAFGVLVLVVGVAMAAIGYWPKGGPARGTPSGSATSSSSSSSSAGGGGGGGGNATSDWRDGPNASAPAGRGPRRGFLAAQLHSYRMKVLGPLTMGIGIFIFICGIAALYENRDRETKVIHLRDIYSAIVDTHRHHHRGGRGAEAGPATSRGRANGPAGRQPGAEQIARCYDARCAARLTAGMLLALPCAISDPKFPGDPRDDLRRGDPLGILGAPFHGGRSGSLYTIHSETCPRSPRSPRGDDAGGPGKPAKAPCRAASIVSSSITAFTLPVIKLNNCVIDDGAGPARRADEAAAEAETEAEGGGDGERREDAASLVDVAVAPAGTPPPVPCADAADGEAEQGDAVGPLRSGAESKVPAAASASPPCSSPSSSPSSYRPMKRQYSNKEKLIMISRLNRNVSFEVEEEFVPPASPATTPPVMPPNPSETHL